MAENLNPRNVTLAGIADGAAEELFAAALAKVVENLVDPNTDHKKSRRIMVVFDFSTDEDRRVGDVVISVKTTLAAGKGHSVGIYIGKHEGTLLAVEAPKQTDMFPRPEGRPHPVAAAGGKS